MKIALDYDKTYTLDPAFWDLFIKNAKVCGHEVKIVTMRQSDPAARQTIFFPPCDVIYTDLRAKKDFYNADVWIDDHPQYVHNDHWQRSEI
jgi:hypothetical protein